MVSQNKTMSRKEIQHISWLARIELSKKEEEIFTEQLSSILEYFRKIDKVDTRKVEPTHHVLDLTNVSRFDEVRQSSPDTILQGVPNMKGRWVKAPRMA